MPPFPSMNDELVNEKTAEKLMKALEPVTSLAHASPVAYGLFTDVLDAVGTSNCHQSQRTIIFLNFLYHGMLLSIFSFSARQDLDHA